MNTKVTENKKVNDNKVQKISLFIPAWLHREAQLHRIETGESMTKLIVRLLTEELGQETE